MADFGPPARKRRASGAGVAAASSELPGSTLRVWLLEMYAWGLLTPQQVQAISERALRDAREKRISDLEPLARLGSSGRRSNNVNRDLVKLVGQLPKMCDPSRITLRKSAAEVAVPIEGVPADEHAYTITLPHELFSSICRNYKAAWHQVIMPGQNYLDRFWQAAKNLLQWADHPLAQERSLTRLLPLSIHGDETPILSKGKIWSSSALIFSWTSLLSNIFALGTKKSQLYIWAVWRRSFNKQTNDDFLPCCCGLSRLCVMADSHTEIGGDSRSSPAVLRAAELANGLQMGGEAFWWPAVETWTTCPSFRAFQGGIQIPPAACAGSP